MPSSRGASRGPGKQQQQHSSMEATVVDFDAAMQVMEEEKTKRTLQRGGSGAGPPVAKARSAPMDLDPSQAGGGAAASSSGAKLKTAEETPVPDGKEKRSRHSKRRGSQPEAIDETGEEDGRQVGPGDNIKREGGNRGE